MVLLKNFSKFSSKVETTFEKLDSFSFVQNKEKLFCMPKSSCKDKRR